MKHYITHLYYIGLLLDWKVNCNRGNNPLKGKLTVQLRRNKDYLSCELWKYLGTIGTTKKYANETKLELLKNINNKYNTKFTRITID